MAEKKKLKIVLKEQVENIKKQDGTLAEIGDKVEVARGYGRQLIKDGKAVYATNREAVAAIRENINNLRGADFERKNAASTLAKKLNGLSLIFVRNANPHSGALYGSVNPTDIAKEINEQVPDAGVTGRQIRLGQAFKELVTGEEVTVQLHPEVAAKVNINIARSEDDADRIRGDYEYVVFAGDSSKTIENAIVVLVRPEEIFEPSEIDDDFDVAELFDDEVLLVDDEPVQIDRSIEEIIEQALRREGVIIGEHISVSMRSTGSFIEDGCYSCSSMSSMQEPKGFFVVKAETAQKAERYIEEAKSAMQAHRDLEAHLQENRL